MTDTGSFKFSSTSAYTHRVVADLMDAGLVPDHVHNSIFDNNSYDRLQLLGYALSNKFEYDADLGISIIGVSLSEKNRFKYQKGDTAGLVNYGLSVKGSKMAVFLSPETTGETSKMLSSLWPSPLIKSRSCLTSSIFPVSRARSKRALE